MGWTSGIKIGDPRRSPQNGDEEMLKVEDIVPRNTKVNKTNIFFEDGSCRAWLCLNRDWEFEIIGYLPENHWLGLDDFDTILDIPFDRDIFWSNITFALKNGLFPYRPFLVHFDKPKYGKTPDTWMGPSEYWAEYNWEIIYEKSP